MGRLTKAKDFLEKLSLSDSDYQDSGMIDHIADLLERYHTEQLRLHNVSERFSLINKQDPKFEILFRKDKNWSAYDHQLTDMMREMVLRYNDMAEYLNSR